MNDRLKFKAVLKTSEFTILVKPYYILEDSYLIDINQAETEFENKYPEECFWDFIDEIKKQDYIQEISSDSDLIITKDFTNLMQCTGLKDKNGKLIYEGDIVRVYPFEYNGEIIFENYSYLLSANLAYLGVQKLSLVELEKTKKNLEIIGNVYENKELLECQK